MRTRAWLVALWIAPAIPAWADDLPLPDGRRIPVDDPAPRPAPTSPLTGSPRAGAGQADPGVPPGAPVEGVWTWITRLEGAKPLDRVATEVATRPAPVVQPPAEEVVPPPAPGQPIQLHLDRFDAAAFDVPVVVNRDVERWMTYFLGTGRKHYQRYLDRSGLVEPLMRQALREGGLPQDLIYLSLIESGYNLHAYSEAGAAGLWQFMPSTGRMYDLRVDAWIDDRRDAIRSTRAAVAHLRDLHVMFDGDWLLAWSAYNAGPGRVRKAIAAGGTRDFWVLSAKGHLPAETANYAPKLMAAAIIGHSPALYGFRVPPTPPLEVDVAFVEGAVATSVLARCAGLSEEEFAKLNPSIRRWSTPAEGHLVNLPRGSFSAFLAALEAVPVRERVHYGHHAVKKGETLGKIAQAHGVTVSDLVKANQLASADRISVGQSLVVPKNEAEHAPYRPAVGGAPARLVEVVAPPDRRPAADRAAQIAAAPSASAAGASAAPPRTTSGGAPVVAPVASSPSGVRSPVEVGTPAIEDRPRPSSPPVASASAEAATAAPPDPTFTAPEPAIAAAPEPVLAASVASASPASPDPGPTATPAVVVPINADSGSPRTYRVRPGDTLSELAAKNRVPLRDLAAWNQISPSAHLRVGQVLTLQPSAEVSNYRVRPGDSLGAIAQAHGCSLSELRAWNNLSGDVIHPGQVLRVVPRGGTW